MHTKYLIAGALSFLISLDAMAHHSIRAHYDPTRQISVTGTLAKVIWRNPHVAIEITETTDDGTQKTWHADAGALNSIERLGIDPETFGIGDDVTLTGPPHRREDDRMVAAILVHNGTEYPVFPSFVRGRSDEGQAGVVVSGDGARIRPQPVDDIFQVWTAIEFPIANRRTIQAQGVSLLPDAQAQFDAYDSADNDLALQCVKPGMPGLLMSPYQIELVDRGDHIEINYEEWGHQRQIFMNGRIPDDYDASIYGESLGYRDDGDLLIITNNIDYPYFDDGGTPMSDAMKVTEQYSLSDDGMRLNLSVLIDDPNVFSDEISFDGYFMWSPDHDELVTLECVDISIR